MEPADLLYPYALAFRWGEARPAGATFDPHIAAATRLLRERLAGVRVVRVEERELAIADLDLPLSQRRSWRCYLNGLSGDERRERAHRAAMELGALARAGADGGRGRARHRRLLRRRGDAARRALARPRPRQGAARASCAR